MSSVRLTKFMRQSIAHDLVAQAMMADVAKYNKKSLWIAGKIDTMLHPPKMRTIMEMLPDGAFTTITSFRVTIPDPTWPGRTITAYPGTEFSEWNGGSGLGEFQVYACYAHSARLNKSELSPHIMNLLDDLEKERLALRDKKNEIFAKAHQALQAFKTLKQVEEGWPEILPIVQQHIPPAPAQVPCVRLEELNKLLGIGGKKNEG